MARAAKMSRKYRVYCTYENGGVGRNEFETFSPTGFGEINCGKPEVNLRVCARGGEKLRGDDKCQNVDFVLYVLSVLYVLLSNPPKDTRNP